MNDPRHVGRKVLFGCSMALALLASAPAFAATYNIGLFQGATGTGSGSFTFTNSGTSGSTSISISTNASSSIGARTFNPANLNVQVAAVNFNDNKTTAPSGSNQITGNYVEGLTGSLETTPATGLTPTGGHCKNNECFYRITFSFAPNPNPNAAGVKTYVINLIKNNDNIDSTPVPNGTYSVNNTATIPEPGSLALLCIGFAALVWSATRRPRPRGAAA